MTKTQSDYKAITHVGLPDRRLPILLACKPPLADTSVVLYEEGYPKLVPVRTVADSILEEGLDGKKIRRMVKKLGAAQFAIDEYNRMLHLLDLAEAIRTGVDKKIKSAIVGLGVPFWKEREPAAVLAETITRLICRAQVVAWQYRPSSMVNMGIFCRDVSTAMSMLAVYRIGKEGGAPKACQACGKTLTPKQVKWCSAACRVRINVRNLRKRKKYKAAKSSKLRARKSRHKPMERVVTKKGRISRRRTRRSESRTNHA